MSFRQTLSRFFGNSAVKKALTWLLIIIVAVTVVLTQFAFPIRVKYKSAELHSYSGNKYAVTISNVYNTLSGGDNSSKHTVLLSDTEFDMSDPENYLRVELVFDFINIGMYKISDIQFHIDSIDKYKEAFVFKEAAFARIDRFSGTQVSLFFVINIEGLTEEQINEAVNSITLSYSFERPELFASGGSIELPQLSLPFDDIIKE